MRKRSPGFWLSEVMTAVWLLTFVGAGLLGLFLYLTKSTKLANERASAELLADSLLERGVREGPPNWGLEPQQLGQVLISQEGPPGTELLYSLSPLELESHRLGKLFLVQVEVSWTGPAGATRGVERGRGRLDRDRQVYIEDVETEDALP